MLRFIAFVVFSATLAVIVIDGLGWDLLPVEIEQYWPHHIAVFALLALSARLAFPRTLMFWTLVYSVLLALLVELIQGLMPQHGLSLVHVAANIGGVVTGLGLAWLWKRQLHLLQAMQEH